MSDGQITLAFAIQVRNHNRTWRAVDGQTDRRIKSPTVATDHDRYRWHRCITNRQIQHTIAGYIRVKDFFLSDG
jgi:hypothetical protein